MSRRVRQRLCGVMGNENLAAGMELHLSEKMVGRITSAVFSERFGEHLGLAMIKRGFTDPGVGLIAMGDGRNVNVRVKALPFRDQSGKASHSPYRKATADG